MSVTPVKATRKAGRAECKVSELSYLISKIVVCTDALWLLCVFNRMHYSGALWMLMCVVLPPEGSSCFKIVKMIMERQFAPVIVFSFSKKDCEAYAVQMMKLDFNTGESW